MTTFQNCRSLYIFNYIYGFNKKKRKFSEFSLILISFLYSKICIFLNFRTEYLLLVSLLPTRRTSRDVRRVGNKLTNKSESPRPRLVLDTPPHPIMLYRSYCTSTRDAARYFATVRVLHVCGQRMCAYWVNVDSNP